MTTATFSPDVFTRTSADRADTRPTPAPRHRRPVFIQDCVTPFDGTTMLLALLRADLDKAADQDW